MTLITGATGYIGSTVVRQLHAAGNESVVACVRSASKAMELLSPDIATQIADYDDPRGLVEAFRGVRQLFFVPSDGFDVDILRHCRNVIEAAQASGVEHLVFLSILDVASSSPFYYAPVYRDAEARLRAAGMKWTILRCGLYADFVQSAWLEESWATGELSLPAQSSRVSLISRSDVATAAVFVLRSADRYVGKVLHLTGPEALSFDDIARQTSAKCGSPIAYRPIEASEYLLHLQKAMSEPWPLAFSTLLGSVVQGRFAEVSSDFERVVGWQAETFTQFLDREQLSTV